MNYIGNFRKSFPKNFGIFRTLSRSISENIEKYFLKNVSNNVLVSFGNFFEKFRKIKSENFEVYCGKFRELFQKIFFNFGTFQEQTIEKFSNTTEDV